MADPVVDDDALGDMDVDGEDAVVAVETAVAGDGEDGDPDFPDLLDRPARVSFLEYLKSPIVELLVGSGDQQITIYAHQDLLTQSPYFEQACADFGNSTSRLVTLVEDDPDAMGSFVEYLYRGDYFPRSVDGTLETDPSIPAIDSNGDQLLKHARVYTLADKFSIPALKSLAHTKIHRTTSTARGEISYARFVYESAPANDTTLRKPVAAFWATRSHVLRHEAEEEFRAMCLEYPQFGFDVLSILLDQKEKRTGGGPSGGSVSGSLGGASVSVETPGSAARQRKRARLGAA